VGFLGGGRGFSFLSCGQAIRGTGRVAAIAAWGLGRDRAMGRRCKQAPDDIAEEFCFVCKDGGDLRVCDFK
jgi:hypothetical protein